MTILLEARPPAAARRVRGVHTLGLGTGRDGLVFVPSTHDPARDAERLLDGR